MVFTGDSSGKAPEKSRANVEGVSEPMERRDWAAMAKAVSARQDSVTLLKVEAMTALIAHVRARIRLVPSASSRRIVDSFTREFDARAARLPRADLNLFAFHVPVPRALSVIEYVDVRHDQAEFDYERLVEHFVWAASAFNRNARVYLVTGAQSGCHPPGPGLAIARLETDTAAPMLERVRAMNAYVNSKAFSADTVFLDTDAFSNAALEQVFRHDFDIGVTYRTDPGYMPLNEGVIFCSRSRPEAVRRFFDMYLATYESLMVDPTVRSVYQNIARWRGGQLSLNAIACPAADLATVGQHIAEGVRVSVLPCETHNYWVRSLSPGTWDEKLVLHLRGESKRLVDLIVEYQRGRARSIGEPSSKDS